jgi:hypothetical protein
MGRHCGGTLIKPWRERAEVIPKQIVPWSEVSNPIVRALYSSSRPVKFDKWIKITCAVGSIRGL